MKTLKRSCILAVALSALLCADVSYAGYKGGGFRSRPISRPAYKSVQKPAQKPKQQPSTTTPKKQQQVLAKPKHDADYYRRITSNSSSGTSWLPWLVLGMAMSNISHTTTTAPTKDEAKPCAVIPPLRCEWMAGT